MELPLQHIYICNFSSLGRGFNPCFNGTTSATKLIFSYPQVIHKVSILVLMELPLQLLWRDEYSYSFLSFNPCFNGTTSATITVPIASRVESLFQSLF